MKIPFIPVKANRKDKPHLVFISQLPCCVSGKYPAIAHHLLRVPGELRGVGMKTPDHFTIPLHHTIHAELHAHGNEEKYLSDNGINGVSLALTLHEYSKKGWLDSAQDMLEQEFTDNWKRRALKELE